MYASIDRSINLHQFMGQLGGTESSIGPNCCKMVPISWFIPSTRKIVQEQLIKAIAIACKGWSSVSKPANHSMIWLSCSFVRSKESMLPILGYRLMQLVWKPYYWPLHHWYDEDKIKCKRFGAWVLVSANPGGLSLFNPCKDGKGGVQLFYPGKGRMQSESGYTRDFICLTCVKMSPGKSPVRNTNTIQLAHNQPGILGLSLFNRWEKDGLFWQRNNGFITITETPWPIRTMMKMAKKESDQNYRHTMTDQFYNIC